MGKSYAEIIMPYKDREGGLIEALHALNREFNYIPEEALKEAARIFKIPESKAYGVATFYAHFSVKKRGTYIIRMCESAPCHVAGADRVLKALEDYLGIKAGETTPDGKFTLELCECIGQCQATPVITINEDIEFNVSPEKIPEILKKYE